MDDMQAYMVYEYVADFKAGSLARRDLVRRVLNITGGLGTTATLLLALGCQPTAATPTSRPATAAPAGPTTSAAASPSALPVARPLGSPPPSVSASPVGLPVASPAASTAASPVATGARSPISAPANDPAIDGQDITFAGNDGATIIAYQARPAASSGSQPLVLVCHENRGLTEHIRDVARRFAKQGYLACAVDLLSRGGGTARVTDPNQFSALLTGPSVNQDQFVADFDSAVSYYTSRPALAQADRIAMIGFCFGGGIVWRASEQIASLRAAAPFYGAPPPLDRVTSIKAAVLGVYSADPNDFANTRRDELDQALTAAGVTHKFNVYPGTTHAFHNDAGQAYVQDQALQAWWDMLAWFKEHLAPA